MQRVTIFFFFFQAEDGIRDFHVTGVQTCALPIFNGKAPLFDVEAAIATQRKNVEALTAANRVAFEGVQAVFRRQAELVRESVDELSKASKEFTAASSTEDKLAKQAELAKSAFETALANVRELSEIVQKAGEEAVSVLSKRVVDNFDEVKTALQPKVNGKK